MATGYSRPFDPANLVVVHAATQTLGTAYSTQVPDQSGTYKSFLPVPVRTLPANTDSARQTRRDARKGRKISGRSVLS
jgi:hypothetical protein